MPWRSRLAALLLLVGIVLSPLRAVAATVPMLFACDAAVGSTATVRIHAGPSVRPERTGTAAYVYDDAYDRYDDASNPPVAGGAGADHAYDRALKLARWREVDGHGAIYGAAAATAAAEAVGEAPTIEITGEADVYFHYTSAPESSFSGGFWEGSSVTDLGDYTAAESTFLGIPTPDKVIPIIDNGSFTYGGTVPASGPYFGGAQQWFASEPIPASNILPAQSLAGAP